MSGKPGEYSIAFALNKSMNETNGENPEDNRYPQEDSYRSDKGWRNNGDNGEPYSRYNGERSGVPRRGYGSRSFNHNGNMDNHRNYGNFRRSRNLLFFAFPLRSSV